MFLDWKEREQEVYVIDIETDSLTPSVIWCMGWENAKTGEKGMCTSDDQIRNFFKETAGSLYVGHNVLGFDAPALNRVLGVGVSFNDCIDTLVLSTLYSPSISGGHSLEAWGERLGEDKIDFDDWSKLSDEMITYCHKDVTITAQLFKRLIKTLDRIGFSEGSIWIQHKLQVITNKQSKAGFKFNGPEAVAFYSELRKIEGELKDEIQKAFPPERVLVVERSLLKKDGTYTAIYLKDRERYITEKSSNGETYKAYEDVEFNIGSPAQRMAKLTGLGWAPQPGDPTTKTGNPKPFEKGELAPSLEKFLEDHDVPEVALIAKWMIINGRANMVNTWLENWNEETECIHGKLFVADTLRFRHQAPNTANIPAVRQTKSGEILYGEDGHYTYEARNLWTSRPGRLLVGTDASGLELRMLAHYLNRPQFTEQVVEGDPHQYNADTVGVTRPQAKTLILIARITQE